MSNNKFNDFVQVARSVRLTPAEKASIRLALVRELEARPQKRYAYSFFHAHFFRYSLLALMFLILTGGGVSAAAERSVPGEILYKVKLSVNEGLRDGLSSGAQRAAWEAAKIARRLEEAETLVSRGTLEPGVQATLAASVTRSSKRFQVELARLAEEDDRRVVTSAKTNLGAALKAHERILDTAVRQMPEQAEEVAPVIAVLQETRSLFITDLADIANTEDNNQATEPAIASAKLAAPEVTAVTMVAAQPATTTISQAGILELDDEDLQETEERVKELQELVEASEEYLDEKSANQLNERLEAVSEALSAGQGERAKGLVEETRILLKAKQKKHLKELDLGL